MSVFRNSRLKFNATVVFGLNGKQPRNNNNQNGTSNSTPAYGDKIIKHNTSENRDHGKLFPTQRLLNKKKFRVLLSPRRWEEAMRISSDVACIITVVCESTAGRTIRILLLLILEFIITCFLKNTPFPAHHPESTLYDWTTFWQIHSTAKRFFFFNHSQMISTTIFGITNVVMAKKSNHNLSNKFEFTGRWLFSLSKITCHWIPLTFLRAQNVIQA